MAWQAIFATIVLMLTAIFWFVMTTNWCLASDLVTFLAWAEKATLNPLHLITLSWEIDNLTVTGKILRNEALVGISSVGSTRELLSLIKRIVWECGINDLPDDSFCCWEDRRRHQRAWQWWWPSCVGSHVLPPPVASHVSVCPESKSNSASQDTNSMTIIITNPRQEGTCLQNAIAELVFCLINWQVCQIMIGSCRNSMIKKCRQAKNQLIDRRMMNNLTKNIDSRLNQSHEWWAAFLIALEPLNHFSDSSQDTVAANVASKR